MSVNLIANVRTVKVNKKLCKAAKARGIWTKEVQGETMIPDELLIENSKCPQCNGEGEVWFGTGDNEAGHDICNMCWGKKNINVFQKMILDLEVAQWEAEVAMRRLKEVFDEYREKLRLRAEEE